MHALLLRPMTVERVFRMAVSGKSGSSRALSFRTFPLEINIFSDHESWVFAVRLTARAWTTAEVEVEPDQIQGGEIVGSGATGVVLKTQYKGRVVAVKVSGSEEVFGKLLESDFFFSSSSFL